MMEKTEKPINHKTCNDCIHFDVCDEKYRIATHDYMTMNSRPIFNEKCLHHFKDNSRYIELPCAVGDKVWFDTYKKSGTVSLGIQPHKVDRIDVVIVTDTKSLIETQTYSWEIGKRVFLTKEEAEQALKGGAE